MKYNNHQISLFTLQPLHFARLRSLSRIPDPRGLRRDRERKFALRILVFRRSRKMFSTSCIYMVPDQNNSIDQDTKNNILKDLKKYDKDNNKPSFHNPGYPDCEDVANSSRTKEEYEKLLDKVKAKYSIKSELDDHNKKAEAEVVQK